MWSLLLSLALAAGACGQIAGPRSGDELVSTVLDNCSEMGCVKQNVLMYLDNVLHVQSDVRNAKVVSRRRRVVVV